MAKATPSYKSLSCGHTLLSICSIDFVIHGHKLIEYYFMESWYVRDHIEVVR